MGDGKLPEWCDPKFVANAQSFFGGAVDFAATLGPKATQAFPGAARPEPEPGSDLTHHGLADGEIEVIGTGREFLHCAARFRRGEATRLLLSGIGNEVFANAVASYRQKHGM